MLREVVEVRGLALKLWQRKIRVKLYLFVNCSTDSFVETGFENGLYFERRG